MDAERLQEIKDRLAAALHTDEVAASVVPMTHAQRSFDVHCYRDIPDLIAEIERLSGEIERLLRLQEK